MPKKMTLNILISLIIGMSVSSLAFAEEKELLIQGVKYYKEGNYLRTAQIMEQVAEDNPGSALAYYYIGISYAKLGDANKAELAYEKVIGLSPESQLGRYAKIGIRHLKEYPAEKTTEITETLDDTSALYAEQVEREMKDRNLKFIIEKINRNKKIDPEEYRKFEDFSPDKSMGRPDNEEIIKAMQVLMKAGLNPYANNQNPAAMNPQLMQMNMMAGNMYGRSNNNNPMDMLPMLMMMQAQQNGSGMGQENYNPQFIQSMMSNMMMPDMMDFSEKRDY